MFFSKLAGVVLKRQAKTEPTLNAMGDQSLGCGSNIRESGVCRVNQCDAIGSQMSQIPSIEGWHNLVVLPCD